MAPFGGRFLRAVLEGAVLQPPPFCGECPVQTGRNRRSRSRRIRSRTAQAAMERSRSRFKKRRISRERPLCRGSPSAGSGSCFSLPPEGSVRPQCCAQKAGETVRPHGLTPERGSGVQPHGRFGRSSRCRRIRARRRSTNDGAGGGAAFRQHGAPAHQGQGAVGPPPFFRIGARDASEETAEAGADAADGCTAGAAWTREAAGEEAGAGAAEAREKPSGFSGCGRKLFSAGAAHDGAAAGETAGGPEEAGLRAAGASEAREAPGKAAAEEAAGAAGAICCSRWGALTPRPRRSWRTGPPDRPDSRCRWR